MSSSSLRKGEAMYVTNDRVNDLYEVYLRLPANYRAAVAGEAQDNLMDGDPVSPEDFRYEVAMIIERDRLDMLYTDTALHTFTTAVASNPDATIVVTDAHANPHFVTFLALAGITDEDGNRLLPNPLVHSGDLMDGNYSRSSTRQDLMIMDIGGAVFDVLLVGNHELPYYSRDDRMGFGGMNPDPGLYVGMSGFRRHHGDKIRFAYTDGTYLVTHAGLVESLRVKHGLSNDVTTLTDEINDLGIRYLYKDETHPVINAIGPLRGGWHETGGIQWADWYDDMIGDAPSFHQVVGHTPIRSGDSIAATRRERNSYCFDYGKGTLTAVLLLDKPVRFTVGAK